jgi:glucose/arabinose dehydrogenase
MCLATALRHAEGRRVGPPVGVAVASDGALLVSDDADCCVWRIEATTRP